MLDENNYPDEESLNKIRSWKLIDILDYHHLMDFVRENWNYADFGYFTKDGNIYTLHTGGWSGNEEVVAAMENNIMFWIIYWDSSKRGGHYTFSPIGQTREGRMK